MLIPAFAREERAKGGLRMELFRSMEKSRNWVAVNPDKDVVKVNGKLIQAHTQSPLSLMVNKPKGFTCSNEDEYAQRLIFDLLERKHKSIRLFCAGRLDVESEGLVILTNDGSLAHRLTHPSNEIKKRYQVELKTPLTAEHLPLLIKGTTVEEDFLRIDEIRAKNGKPIGNLKLEVTLGHGKKREIRRIFQHFGYRIKSSGEVNRRSLLHKLPSGNTANSKRKKLICSSQVNFPDSLMEITC